LANPNGVNAGKNIGYGILFFVIIAVACGSGCFISIVTCGESMLFFGILGSFMVIFSGPILALIVGIVQGKTARSEKEALVAGGVTGVAGYIILLIIIVVFIIAAFAIRFPPSDDDGEDDIDSNDSSVDINWGEMFGQFGGLFLPSGIIGAFAAFFSSKLIFAPQTASGYPPAATGYPPPAAVVAQPPQSQYAQPTQPQYPSQPAPQPAAYQAPQPATQPVSQPAVQQQTDSRFKSMSCPTCGHTFDVMVPDKPTKINCPSCGQEGIIGL
jgi:ribosomal protein S27E